ncbi:MAG: hypothetical protein R2712_16770 [Vicinamibacterales bacterium]
MTYYDYDPAYLGPEFEYELVVNQEVPTGSTTSSSASTSDSHSVGS